MGFDSRIYLREMEDAQSESLTFDGNSALIGFFVLLFIMLSTFLCGYGVSLLISALIH